MATYNEILAKNIKAARSRIGLSQRDAIDRMRALGFAAWHAPTLGNVERGERSLKADEVFGLALALNTTVERLMRPLPEDGQVEMTSEVVLPWQSAAIAICGPDPNGEASERADRHVAFHRGIRWDGGNLVRVTSRHERDEEPEGS